jgi:hypothetical protein
MKIPGLHDKHVMALCSQYIPLLQLLFSVRVTSYHCAYSVYCLCFNDFRLNTREYTGHKDGRLKPCEADQLALNLGSDVVPNRVGSLPRIFPRYPWNMIYKCSAAAQQDR